MTKVRDLHAKWMTSPAYAKEYAALEDEYRNHGGKQMFNVYNSIGTPLAQNVDLNEAAETVMLYDGHEYDIRRGDGEWVLYTSPYSRNSTLYSGLRPTGIGSVADDKTAATAEIYQQVISHADRWRGCWVETVGVNPPE